MHLSKYSQASLKEKLDDKDFVDALSDILKGKLEICREMLTDKELQYYSSISTAYKIARKRYIETNFDEEFIEERKSINGRIFVRYSDIIRNSE
jgi:hypothetical protein